MGDQQRHPGERAAGGAPARRAAPSRPHVERGERLVEQQQARVGGQRPGDRHPLRLAAGQLARAAAASAPTPSRSSQSCARSRAVPPGDAAAARAERDVGQGGRGAGRAAAAGTRRRRRAPGRVTGGRPSSSHVVAAAAHPALAQRHSPARARSRVDLPAPLGPITATTSPGAAVRRTSRCAPAGGRPRGRRAPFHRRRAGAGGGHRAAWSSQRSRSSARTSTETSSSTTLSAMARLGVGLQCVYTASGMVWRGAGEVAGEGDGGAELAERACPGQHHPGDDAGQREGHRHPAEDRPAVAPKVAATTSYSRLGGAQRALHADHEEREGHEGVREHHRARGVGMVTPNARAAARRPDPCGRTRSAARRPATTGGSTSGTRHQGRAPARGRGTAPGPAPRPAAARAPGTAPPRARRSTSESRSASRTAGSVSWWGRADQGVRCRSATRGSTSVAAASAAGTSRRSGARPRAPPRPGAEPVLMDCRIRAPAGPAVPAARSPARPRRAPGTGASEAATGAMWYLLSTVLGAGDADRADPVAGGHGRRWRTPFPRRPRRGSPWPAPP